jgi:hypothetical protein
MEGVHLRWISFVATAVLLAGCDALGPTPLVLQETDGHLADTPRNLPTHRDGASMLAELEGALNLEGPCLLVGGTGLAALPIWPSNFWLDGMVLMSGRTPIARVGDRVRLSGGTIPIDNVGGRLTNPIPAECTQQDIFWTGGVHIVPHPTPGLGPHGSTEAGT